MGASGGIAKRRTFATRMKPRTHQKELARRRQRRRRFARTAIQGAKVNVSTATSNGEVEGPGTHVSQARLARNIYRVQPRLTTHASRTPPTIVRSHAKNEVLRLVSQMRPLPPMS